MRSIHAGLAAALLAPAVLAQGPSPDAKPVTRPATAAAAAEAEPAQTKPRLKFKGSRHACTCTDALSEEDIQEAARGAKADPNTPPRRSEK